MPFAGPSSARFAAYTYVEDWPQLIVAVDELSDRLALERRPLAARALLEAYVRLRDGMLALGREMEVKATRSLIESERRTRVRPDTGGGGGPRLENALVAEAIDQDIMPGAIGIADEELLDNRVPWWTTNEEGSSARVGGTLYGTFFGSSSFAPPDPGQFREHPLFAPGPGVAAGVGTIENPIPERRFIKKALPEIYAAWQSRALSLRQAFEDELKRVLAMQR